MNENQIKELYMKRVNEICSIHNLPIPILKISGRLVKSAGNIRAKNGVITISVSKALIDQFGVERGYKTLNHELAHLYEWIKFGKFSHGPIFMKMCEEFGGSVNQMKAASYGKESIAETRYVKGKYKYTCKCGKFFYTSIIYRKKAETHFCKACGTKVKYMTMETL